MAAVGLLKTGPSPSPRTPGEASRSTAAAGGGGGGVGEDEARGGTIAPSPDTRPTESKSVADAACSSKRQINEPVKKTNFRENEKQREEQWTR